MDKFICIQSIHGFTINKLYNCINKYSNEYGAPVSYSLIDDGGFNRVVSNEYFRNLNEYRRDIIIDILS